ncbi:MAG: hypothetical protein Kow0037_30820 [Calditrichia bacterium]
MEVLLISVAIIFIISWFVAGDHMSPNAPVEDKLMAAGWLSWKFWQQWILWTLMIFAIPLFLVMMIIHHLFGKKSEK